MLRRREGFLIALALGGIAGMILACESFGATDKQGSDAAIGDDGGGNGAFEGGIACDAAGSDDDVHNCGACGHDCLGGACVAGSCKPVALAVSPEDVPVMDVVVDQERVVWLTAASAEGSGPHGLYACSKKTGCGASTPTNLAAGKAGGNLGSNGVDRVFVSFIYAGVNGIFRFAANGDLQKIPGISHGDPRNLVVRPEGLYYVAFYEPSESGYGRTLYRWDDAKEEKVGVFAGTGDNTAQSAFTKDRFFLGSHNTGLIVGCSIADCSSGMTDFLRDGVALVASMAASDDTVFWSDGFTLRSCPAGLACASITENLAPQDGYGNLSAVTFAAGELYIQSSQGDLVACNPSDCKRTRRLVVHEPNIGIGTLNADPSPPGFNTLYGHNVTADAKAIYYTAYDAVDGGVGTWRIMKIAK